MKLTCNIDMYGRLLRGGTGVLLLVNGVIMLLWNMPGAGFWSRLLQGLMIAMGLFTLFEAAVGWCAIRAMGFRTKI